MSYKKFSNMEDFIIRSYTKKELALMYFPQSNPRTAVNHLMVWIRRCTPLWDELLQTGYKTTPCFSAGQSGFFPGRSRK